MASRIVEEISKLTVMELANLVKEIEETFGVTAAAPMAVAAPAAAAAAAAPAEEKTEFTVKLKDSGADKIKAIKALRTVMTALSLKDAKDKIEAAPCVLAEGVSKEEAQKIKEALEAAGASVELA